MGSSPNTTGRAASPGIRWVENYLQPLIDARLTLSTGTRLSCLQVEPDDETEANCLRDKGHDCQTVVLGRDRHDVLDWRHGPVVADPAQLPFEAERFDLIFSGAFCVVARTAERRLAVARELARVCRARGAVLLTLGNRLCPIDLSRHVPLLHTTWRRDMVSLPEMEQLFLGECGFESLRPLSLAGHFGWSSLSGAKRWLVPALNRYLAWAAAPERPRRYASPLNPLLSLWLTRSRHDAPY